MIKSGPEMVRFFVPDRKKSCYTEKKYMHTKYLATLSLALLFVTAIPTALAAPMSPAECEAVGGSCKRSIFGSNCSGSETEVAMCNTGSKGCCLVVKDSSGTVLSGQAAINQFNSDVDSGKYYTKLDAVPVSQQSGQGMTSASTIIKSSSSAPTSTTWGNYQLLEGIPGQSANQSDLPGYVKSIINAGLILIVLSAVFMVTVGGFLYLTSAGNTSKAGTAKSIIQDSLIGLGLAMLAYLILYIINPDLVNLRLSQLSADGSIPATQSPTGTAVPTTSTGDTYTHAEAVSMLSSKGISTSSSGNCSDQNNKSCTSLNGIPKATIANVIALKDKTGCSFKVTGGTEVGHATHGTGRPVVDLSEEACLDTAFKNKDALSSYQIKAICADNSNQAAAYKCSYVEPKPHFHVQFAS